MDIQPNIRPALQALLANRHTPEARGLYMTLARYAHRRVENTSRRRFSDVLAAPDREELVAEVLLQLMSGALARFQGHSVGELLAFVRTISDRLVSHSAFKRIRERDTLAGEMGDHVRNWMSRELRPDEAVRLKPKCPLNEEDAQYLTALFSSGSRADLARDRGISRAAVTQRITRIKNRIDALPAFEQRAAKAWVEELAHLSAEGMLVS
jgi:hypothetical protein